MAAIGQLSQTHRETTTLFYINGYSVAEVAAVQEVPVGTVKRRLYEAREKLKEGMVSMVEEVLKGEAPKDDFGSQVFEMLSQFDRPPLSGADWDEVCDKLRDIGTDGIEGFVTALESPHSPTRAFATSMLEKSMLEHSAQSDEVVEGLLKSALEDPNKSVRRIAAGALLNIIAHDETKRAGLVPPLVPLLTDRCTRLRRYVAGYLEMTGDVGDAARHVPLERVARALVQEKDEVARRQLIRLMSVVLDMREI